MPHYTSFILRVWQVKQGRRWVWRAMLERVSTGERIGFADLASLTAFLQADAAPRSLRHGARVSLPFAQRRHDFLTRR